MQKVLITGASGFIGGFLAEEMLRRGLDTYAAVRASSNTKDLKKMGVKILIWDFENSSQMSSILAHHQFDYIIHNAGITKSKSKEEFFKVNADYVKNLAEAIRNSGRLPKKLLFVSSLASYGPADFQEAGEVNESSVPHPVTIYGESKLKAENYLMATELPYIIIRPTAVFGPKDKDFLTVFSMINNGFELMAGLAPQLLSFIYIKDLVRLIGDALTSDICRKAYFISDGKVYHAAYFNQLVKQNLKRKTIKLKLPMPLVWLVAHISGFVSNFTGKYPPLNPEKFNEIKARNWACDISPLIKDFNFKPEYDLESGIEETIGWYKSEKWL